MKPYAPFLLEIIESTGSTNDVLKQHFLNGSISHGDALLARTQTAGRGRQDREWISPRGNLHLSICIEPQKRDPKHWPEISLISSLAVLKTLKQENVHQLTLKWPNDILWKNRKCGGILSETIHAAERKAVIIGVGLNLKHVPTSNLRYPATALILETTAESLAEKFGKRILEYISTWEEEGFSNFAREWQYNAARIGEIVCFELPNGTSLEGKFGGVDTMGNALLKTCTELKVVHAGDMLAFGDG